MTQYKEIHVYNIWAEDLFNWFYNHVIDSDYGAAVIICANYQEVSQWFIEWLNKRVPKHHVSDIQKTYESIVNYFFGEKQFMFSDQPINLFSVHYKFFVEEDCYFYKDMYGSKRCIKSYDLWVSE